MARTFVLAVCALAVPLLLGACGTPSIAARDTRSGLRVDAVEKTGQWRMYSVKLSVTAVGTSDLAAEELSRKVSTAPGDWLVTESGTLRAPRHPEFSCVFRPFPQRERDRWIFDVTVIVSSR